MGVLLEQLTIIYIFKRHVYKNITSRILQASLQLYMNRGLLDVQGGFRKNRGTRDQIAKILSAQYRLLSRV